MSTFEKNDKSEIVILLLMFGFVESIFGVKSAMDFISVGEVCTQDRSDACEMWSQHLLNV